MKLSTAVVVLGIVGLIGGCSSTQLASPSSSPTTGPSGAVASAPPSTAPSVAPSATPKPTRTPSATPLPDVGLAPAGRWTSIEWVDGGRAFPQLKDGASESYSMTLFGWSGGFVAFGSDGGRGTEPSRAPTLVSASSPDGLHWAKPSSIDVSAQGDQVTISQVVEGPDGLVAVGRYPADTCGGPPVIAGMWHSTDGETWRAIALPRNMTRGHVETLDGGSAGYIATGKQSDQKTAGIWVSQDAITWNAAALPKPSSGTLVVNGATSFAGGFVVAGAVLGEDGCGGPGSIHPAVWWSADGSGWTRETLPGAIIEASASLTIRRLNDDRVVAISQAGDTPDGWVSTDGRTWTAVPTPTLDALFSMVADNRRSIVVTLPTDNPGQLTLQTVGDRLDVALVSQTGDVPMQTADSAPVVEAVGPTGLVVVSVDGSHLWLGVPSAS